MTDRTAAIVLAGGRSSRFGRDKLAEPIEGRPMLEHVVDRVRAITSDIVVVGPAHGALKGPTGARVVSDDRAFEGPLAGLAVGLRALDPGVECVLVVGGDMPTLVPAVLERLLVSLDRREAAVLADEAGPRPLPMAMRRSTSSAVADRLLQEGERRLRRLADALDVEVIAEETWREDDPDGQTLRDVDTPDDLPG